MRHPFLTKAARQRHGKRGVRARHYPDRKTGRGTIDTRVYCPQGGPVLDQTPEGRQFKADYEQRLHTDPLTCSAALHDGVNIVAQAMKKPNSTEAAQYRAALASMDSRGVSGHYRVDANRDLTESPTTIYHDRNGEPTPLAPAQP